MINIIADWSPLTYSILFCSILVLNHIKVNVSKQLDQNQAAAGKIQGLLKDYEAKLKELDKALKDAGELVKNANTLNGFNAQGMEELQVL